MLGLIRSVSLAHMYAKTRYQCVFARVFVCDLKLSGSIQHCSQTAEQDYGTTGCGCTLPQGFCLGGIDAIFLHYSLTRDSMPSQQFWFVFHFLILWMRLILKSLEAISTQFTMLCRLEQ